jgi:beta-N-acetylhexosaminidase
MHTKHLFILVSSFALVLAAIFYLLYPFASFTPSVAFPLRLSTDSIRFSSNSSLNLPSSSMSWIDKKMATMSIEDKVAQLFVIDLYTVNQTSNVVNVRPNIEAFMNQHPVGGVILFGDNVDMADQTKKLISDLQSNASIPLFISIDEEGGLVSRIGSKNIGVNHLPNAATLQSDYTSSQVEEMARTLGQQLASFGINMNFAPVLDVNTNPNNPVIGTRAFSSDPTLVGEYGTAFMHGLLGGNILPVGKHFPGHGDTTTDSHLERTSIDQTLDELRRVEWLPFQQAIDAGIPVIMTGHIHTPNITQDDLPASLSKAMTTDYLRGELGFDGVVVTDSLRMNAIANEYDASEVGILVLEAGGDLILLPDDFQSCYEGIINALDSGRLTEERIDRSLRRLLALKNTFMETAHPED